MIFVIISHKKYLWWICGEYAYKLFNGFKGVSVVFNSQYNKIYLLHNYHSFLKQQNIVFSCIGKPNTEKRFWKEFEKRIQMNENKKNIDAYNNLLKILNVKNKQFEQNVFNDFLEDQNIWAKQGQSFNIDKYNKVIKKSINPKIKQQFNMIVDKSNEANKPVKDNKPLLKIKSYRSVAKDMYPKSPTFTMKIIAARGMGKSIFLIAFLLSLINRWIVKHENIFIFSSTFNEQDQWRSSSFMERNFNYLNEEYAKGKVLVFDDMQLDIKWIKLVQTLFSRGRDNKTRIIQCEQFTQTTAHIEKANTDFFLLIPPFNEPTAQYYHEKLCQH